MAHIWVRAEQRPLEKRVGLTPSGAKTLLGKGHRVTVEDHVARCIPIGEYADAGCEIAEANDWVNAPTDAIIFGLKELDADGPELGHRHIMFGHAYKGQSDGPDLLRRFKQGGGTLYDLEYLTTETGKRIAAFGYWAGFAGAALGVMAWVAQQTKVDMGAVDVFPSKDALIDSLERDLKKVCDRERDSCAALIIGALGRVGTGAGDLLDALNLPVTRWDMDETAHGGPFPEILEHTIFVNCILANESVPVFVPKTALTEKRALRVIADVSCDPNSPYNPIPVYDRSTTFSNPLIRVADGAAPLDVMAIDNLPSMLPKESSEDYATQLLPSLLELDAMSDGVWGRAAAEFEKHVAQV